MATRLVGSFVGLNEGMCQGKALTEEGSVPIKILMVIQLLGRHLNLHW